MIVWRIRGKIIRTVQYCTVPQLYTVISTHIGAVLLAVLGTAGLDFVWGFHQPVSAFFQQTASN